jgi:hypothetical protein
MDLRSLGTFLKHRWPSGHGACKIPYDSFVCRAHALEVPVTAR